MFPYRSLSRKAAARAAVLGGAALLCLIGPSRGQQPTPGQPTPAPAGVAVQATVPATATGARTRVDYHLTLPAGLRLREWPRVDIFNAAGELLGLVPTRITQRTPVIAGFVRLSTKTFPPGTYLVAVEANLILPDGSVQRVAAPLTTLTVRPTASGG
jgi:hypothetical protein